MAAKFRLQLVSSGASVELSSTVFDCPLTSEQYRSVRGKIAHGSGRTGTFPWTAGVMGLVCTLLKAKCASLLPESDCWLTATGFSSSESSFATSFDSALSKCPNWLLDMLGTDSRGVSHSRRMFIRINAERRRPGPVIVAVNAKFLVPSSIEVELDGKRIETPMPIERLLASINNSATPLALVANGPPVTGLEERVTSRDHTPFVPLLNKLRSANVPAFLNPPKAPAAAAQTPACTECEAVRERLDEIAQLVREHLLEPYITEAPFEHWSCADAVLALARHPKFAAELVAQAPLLLDQLAPADGAAAARKVPVADDVPVVQATRAMALAELSMIERLPELSRQHARESAQALATKLAEAQAKDGWWSVISCPEGVRLYPENARVWDTGYATLALLHLERHGILLEQHRDCAPRALHWLIKSYYPGLGWSNSQKPPLRPSAPLTTFVHFLLTYALRSHQVRMPWRIEHALRHAQSAAPLALRMEALDASDYRIAGASGAALPTPHRVVQSAFLLALRAQLRSRLPGSLPCSDTLEDPIWLSVFMSLRATRAVFPYSQILQAAFLFSE
jgi:hypothetical protein